MWPKTAEDVERWLDRADALWSIADIASRISYPPKPAEIAGLAFKVAHSGLRVYKSLQAHRANGGLLEISAGLYGFVQLPRVITKLLEAPGVLKDPKRMEEYGDVREGKVVTSLWRATLRDVEIRWPAAASDSRWAIDAMFCQETGLTSIYEEVRDRLWQSYGSKVLELISGEFAALQRFSTCKPLSAFETVKKRIEDFTRLGGRRSYLLVGEPGLGKSVFAQSLIRDHTIIIAGNQFSPNDGRSLIGALGFGGAMRALKPSMVILNDIDRVGDYYTATLLSVLEELRKEVSTVLITANYVDKCTSALMRPGRVDDVLHVAGVDESEVAEACGSVVPHDIQSLMVGWPIAFVIEARTRALALGADALRAELPELIARRERNKEKPDEVCQKDRNLVEPSNWVNIS